MAEPSSARSAVPEPSSPRSAVPEPSTASRSYVPDWVLLDPIAHIAPLKNATTAGTMTSALIPIDVSFDIVDPPGVTRCFVNCPELKVEAFDPPPRVIAADGAFLLISVLFRHRPVSGMHTDVFVYKAGPGTPWLHLLQRPCPSNLYSTLPGVLSCGDGHCLLVLPERLLENGRMMGYDLQVYSTETNSWTTRAALVASDLQGYHSPLLRHEPTKVFSVGGGSLAWVDVSLGVLLCDVLGNLEMQLIDLPPLMPTNKVRLGVGLGGSKCSVPAVRDVMCKDGWIRCFEVEFPDFSDINSTEYPWTAILSKRMMFGSDEWETFTVDSASLSSADSCFPAEICYGMGKLALNKVVSTAPVLDAYHENVVYMKSKLLPCDPNGWVLAIDTRDKKLVTAVPFTSRKSYLNHYYLQCDFSNYISDAPENSMAKASEKCTNRENIVLLENHILAALNQLHNIENSMDKASEKCTNREIIVLLENHILAALNQLHNIEVHIASLKQRHSSSMPLLCSGQANIEKVSENNLDHGSRRYVTYPVGEALRFVREIDLHISTPLDAMKKEITDAHGALCKLMQNLTPNVLDQRLWRRWR